MTPCPKSADGEHEWFTITELLPNSDVNITRWCEACRMQQCIKRESALPTHWPFFCAIQTAKHATHWLDTTTVFRGGT